MEADWDLHAVVRRGSAMTTTAATTTSTTSPTSFVEVKKEETNNIINSNSYNYAVPLLDPFEPRKSAYEELHELFKPFLRPKSEPLLLQNTPICSSSLGGFNVQHHQVHLSGPTANPHSHPPSRAAKRRKNVMKKVCQIPAESLSSDVWAWRKYGQKPIKGSPYPRSYYRCSSSKGCLARKQVERNRSDPGMFIVTYTAEHNHPAPTHRNSLAGSTRQKPVTQASDAPGDANTKPACSSPTTSIEEEAETAEMGTVAALDAPRKGNTESRESQSNNSVFGDEEEEEECDNDRCDGENESGSSNVALNDDDFFDGLDGLMGGGIGGGSDGGDRLFSDQFSMFFDLPWTANSNSAATTAAGGS